MKDKSQRLIRLCYSVFLAVFTVAIAVLLLAELLVMWTTQNDPVYSYETVCAAFREIMVPGILWIVAVIAGGVLFYVFPSPKAKGKNDLRYSVRRLKKKLPQDGDDEELIALKKYKRIRDLVWLVTAAVGLICIVCVLVYLCDRSNYRAIDPNATMWNAFLHVFPFIAAAFAVAVGAGIWEGVSAKREMKLIRAYNLGHRAVKQQAPEQKQSTLVVLFSAAAQSGNAFKRKLSGFACNAVLFLESDKGKLTVRCLLAAIGIALFVWGIFNGGLEDVLKKAVNICTECIGLG